MKSPAQDQPQMPAFQRVLSCLLIAFVLVMAIAGVSPGLHEKLHCVSEHSCSHHDSEQTSEEHSETDGHTCAVTLLQSGIVLGDGIIRLPVCEARFSELSFLTESFVYQSCSFVVQARAPPIEV